MDKPVTKREEPGLARRLFYPGPRGVVGLALMIVAGLVIIFSQDGPLTLIPVGAVVWLVGLLVYVWGAAYDARQRAGRPR